MVKLFLLRHGNAIKTDKDTVLSKKGLKQALLLAKKLSKLNISKVYVSDSTRSIQTYEAYKKLKPGVPSIISDKLREIYRVIIGGPERDGTDPSREKNDKLRADEVIRNILDDAKEDEVIAIFSHGNLIRYVLAPFLKIDKPKLWAELQIHETSVSLIDITNNKPQVSLINSIDHLDSKELNDFYNSH